MPKQRLKNIFERLRDITYSRYTIRGIYITQEGDSIKELIADELLEVGREHPREHVMIACFKGKPTRVLYFGEDARAMKETLDKLGLPDDWPSSLGEKVFYLFKSYLRDPSPGPFSIEQAVIPGKEHEFEPILKKLITIYKQADDILYDIL